MNNVVIEQSIFHPPSQAEFVCRLQMVIRFEDLLPGGIYKWNLTGTSLGANPLLRNYCQFNSSTRPAKPLTLIQAAALQFDYGTFQLDIGQLPHVSCENA